MKRLGLFSLFVISSLSAALIPGNRYDFIAKDGQDVKNAVFVKEDKKSYTIKNEFLEDAYVVIEKSALAFPPKPAAPVNIPAKRRWYAYANGNLQTAAGDFSVYSKFFSGASINAAYRFKRIPYLGLNALSAGLQYTAIAESPRRIDMISIGVGPKWFITLRSLKMVDFYVLARPEISLVKFRSYTFDSFNAIPGGAFEIGAFWILKSNIFMSVGTGTKYLYDTNALVLLYHFSVGAGYAW